LQQHARSRWTLPGLAALCHNITSRVDAPPQRRRAIRRQACLRQVDSFSVALLPSLHNRIRTGSDREEYVASGTQRAG
jgi:hypothetical protein